MIDTGRAFRRVVGILEAELADAALRVDQTKALLEQLRAHGDGESTKPNKVVKRRRRRRRGRPRKQLRIETKSKAPSRRRRRRADIVTSASPPSPAPVPEVAAKPKRSPRGAAEFAKELATVSEIMQTVAAAKTAITAAKAAKDKAAVAKAAQELQAARAEGGKLLKNVLNGRAKLPQGLLKAERRAWKKAADNADANAKREAQKAIPKPVTSAKTEDAEQAKHEEPKVVPAKKRRRRCAKDAAEANGVPQPKYPRVHVKEYVDELGILTREFRAEGETPLLKDEGSRL